MSWNWVDLVLLVLLAAGTWTGYRQGLIRQLLRLVGVVFSFFVAFRFYDELAPLLQRWLPFPEWGGESFFSFVSGLLDVERLFYSAIAFGLLFFATKIGLNLVGSLFDFVASLPVLGLFNRFLGALAGFLAVFFLLTILVNLLYVMPFEGIHGQVGSSAIARLMLEKAPVFSEKLRELWKKGDDRGNLNTVWLPDKDPMPYDP